LNGLKIALSSRDRRVLIAGATVIGLLLIVGRALPAWRRWQEGARAKADSAAGSLAGEEAVLHAERAIRDSLASRRHRLDLLAPAWMEGDSPTAGGAALAALVSSAATRADLTIGTINIIADSIRGETFVPVRVRATAIGDIHGIAALLTTIDRGPARLVVRALSIQSTDPAAATDRPELLHAELLVEGAWRRPTWMVRP
jgi:hypothetical protein